MRDLDNPLTWSEIASGVRGCAFWFGAAGVALVGVLGLFSAGVFFVRYLESALR